jgi:hypothetical protein
LRGLGSSGGERGQYPLDMGHSRWKLRRMTVFPMNYRRARNAKPISKFAVAFVELFAGSSDLLGCEHFSSIPENILSGKS